MAFSLENGAIKFEGNKKKVHGQEVEFEIRLFLSYFVYMNEKKRNFRVAPFYPFLPLCDPSVQIFLKVHAV